MLRLRLPLSILRFVWPAVGLLFVRYSLFAAAPQNYFTHLWQAEDGLPQNSVTAIVQTRDGYLWLGTYSGLARFDGVRFTVFDNNSRPLLKHNRITSLFEDSSGTLWIGNETGELTRFRNRTFEEVTTGPWKGANIYAISADEKSDVWLVNEEGALFRERDGERLVPREGNAVGQVAVTRDSEGRLWIARHGRLSRLDDGKLSTVKLAQEASDVYVQGVCASRGGGIWISYNGRLRKWVNNTWKEDLGTAPWGLRGVTAMLETRAGSILTGTVDFGLYIVTPGAAVVHFNQTNGLSQNWVRSLCEDQEGNLWVGSGSSGLVALRVGKVVSLHQPDNWQGRAVLSVSIGKGGAIWITTEGAGLYHYNYQDATWQHFGESEGLSNLFAWSVLEDSEGKPWVATWGGGIFLLENGKLARVKGMENLTVPMTAILHAPHHVTWIGSRTGLLRYENGAVTKFGATEGLESPDVRTIERGADGTLWFGMTGGGLGQLTEDGRLKQFTTADGLSSDYVQSLKQEKDGTLWIGTVGGGLNRLRNGKFVAITKHHGLEGMIISHIEEDAEGFFWMTSHSGIMRVSKAELNDCADGRIGRVNCLTYGKGEGLPTLECSGGLQPAGCKTPDGRLWFPTAKGAVVINPNEAKKNERPPPVVIEEVVVDEQPLETDRVGSGPIRIKPGRHQFQFRCTALSFMVPEKVQFKYRLEGLDPDWRERGTERKIDYGYIPPGDYVFRVKACNNDGVWNEEGAFIAFSTLPYFWQTWLFRTGAGIASAGLVAATVGVGMRRRLQQKLERIERQRAIERERARIAKDIHDELGASLTRITMLSQSARAEPDQPAAAADLDRIYDTAREVTRAMDEIVWAVNPQHDTLDSLASYLGKFAQDFLAAAQIRCRLEVPIQLPPWHLTAEVRHNLFLAFKEAVNNAVKHARTTEVRVILQFVADHFTLRVEDEGCGFSSDGQGQPAVEHTRLGGGNGLKNMGQRLSEIGGRFEIRSVPGKGTIVVFEVPVKNTEPL